MNSLLSRIFQTRRDDVMGSQTASIPESKRLALVSEIECALENDLRSGGGMMEDIIGENVDQVIEETTRNLSKLDEQERFIGMRVESYRKLLDRRAEMLEKASFTSCSNTSLNDFEDDGCLDFPRYPPLSHEEVRKRREQQYEDEENLAKVVALHKNILVEMELCRRNLVNLRGKKEVFVEKREECLDFLAVSSAIDIDSSEHRIEDEHTVSECNIEVV